MHGQGGNYMRISSLVISALLLLAMTGASQAADLQVKDIKAYLFFWNSGVLSENIVGSTKNFDNTGTGDGEAGGAATNILVDLVLTGQDPTPEKQFATLKINYSVQGQPAVLKRTYKTLYFGEAGIIHESVFLENATCGVVRIEAHAGKSSRIATLNFGCGE
jgi:hypothetical protein